MPDDSLPALRASDADRERHAEILRTATGEGRLTMEELDERLDQVYASKTHAELERLIVDVVVPGDHGVQMAKRMPVNRRESGTNWLVSVMSGHDRKGRWRVGRHLKVVNIMGGSDLDLNDAELVDDDVQMTIFSLMGGADVFAFMGGNGIQLGETRPDPGGPTLHLRVISIMGGTDVKRGRKLSRAERKRRKHLEHGH